MSILMEINRNCIFQNPAIVLQYKEHIWLMNGFPNMYAIVLFIEQFFCSRNRKSFLFSWGNVYCKIIMHDNGRQSNKQPRQKPSYKSYLANRMHWMSNKLLEINQCIHKSPPELAISMTYAWEKASQINIIMISI